MATYSAETAATYDAANARTILFGGSGPLGLLNDTWAWDGTTWTKLASPVARTEAAAAYGPGTAGCCRFTS